jgi:hypothetical protein
VISCASTFAQRTRAVRTRPAPLNPPAADQPERASVGNLGEPVRGLTAAQLGASPAARGEFNEDKDAAGGLGPIFNDVSCLRCHSLLVAGGSNPRVVTLFGRTTNGVFDPLTARGGRLLQEHALGPEQGMRPFQREFVPPQATIVTFPATRHGRARRTFRPDGRANNVNDAITAHDGHARTSREAYQRLDAQARASLIAFLGSS